MNDYELTEALQRAQAGDEVGFAELWRALQPPVLRYLRVVVGELAEDVAAETWLQIVRDLPGFRGNGARFRAWLFVVARNRGLDAVRRASRRLEAPADLFALAGRPAAADTEQEVLTWLATERALALIASLPADQAEAVALRVIAGLSAQAAGEVLGKHPGAVRVAAMRGLRRLADQLEREPAGPALPEPDRVVGQRGGRHPVEAIERGVTH